MSAPGDTIGGSSTPDEPFSLTHGGPFHSFTRRFRRTRGEGRLALLLIVVLWVPMAIFSLFEVLIHGRYLGIVRDFSVHTRLLIAMPLLLLAERVLEERCRDCIERFRSGVGAGCDEGVKAAVKRARKLRDSRLAETLYASCSSASFPRSR